MVRQKIELFKTPESFSNELPDAADAVCFTVHHTVKEGPLLISECGTDYIIDHLIVVGHVCFLHHSPFIPSPALKVNPNKINGLTVDWT